VFNRQINNQTSKQTKTEKNKQHEHEQKQKQNKIIVIVSKNEHHTSNVGFQTLRFEKIRGKSCSFVIDVYVNV
jgi:hypothetical protein